MDTASENNSSAFNNKKASKPYLAISSSIVVFILIFFAAGYMLNADLKYRQQVSQSLAVDQVSQLSSLLSSAMNVRLNLTNSLHAYVKSTDNITEKKFDLFASGLIANFSGIRSLQLAPKGVVTYLTDIEYNRAAVGHNLLEDPKRKALALRSIEEDSYIIAGPINLIQGGRAIIARKPIFINEYQKIGSLDSFWGFATVLIDIDQLLSEVNIEEQNGIYSIAIRGKDGTGEAGDVFFGNESVFEHPLATSMITLPNASWQIALDYDFEHMPFGFMPTHLYWLFSFVIAAIITGFTFTIIDRPRQLRRKIAIATESLTREISQRKAAEERILFMAQYDALTGLANRYLFTELALQMIASADRDKGSLSLLFIDLDGFKKVNDELGHKSGDILLKQVAMRLKNIVRRSDVVARLSGDEFVILLSDYRSDTVASAVIKKLGQAFQVGESTVKIGASVGVAVYPYDAHDLDELLHQADIAMYDAKKAGKGRIKFAKTVTKP